jgi:bifunctional polynucleotide phosphatase/kinase
MDGTIILTKSGKVYPIDENDWRIGFDTCFKKFKQLCVDNYKLVIFTNQRGLMKVASTDNFRKKIQYIQQKLNVPLQVEKYFAYYHHRILIRFIGIYCN